MAFGEGGTEVTDMRSARRETLRDFFTAVSILIASASAVFTGMQLREARNAVLVQLKPHVDFDITVKTIPMCRPPSASPSSTRGRDLLCLSRSATSWMASG